MKPRQPLISFILCNYNHGAYIEQAIAGALRQSYQKFEFIITDDGSTDKSVEIIKKYAALDERIKPVYFEKNQGAMAATACNMSRVNGQLLYGGAADDFIIDEHFFKRAVEALDQYPQAAGFYGVAGLYGAEAKKLTGAMGSAPIDGFIPPDYFLPAFLRGQLFVPGNSSIWRYDAYKELGGFDYAMGAQIDYFINHALPIKHGVVFARVPVTCQRVYESQENLGSKGTLWDACSRYARVEEALRRHIPKTYDGIEADWTIWRAKTAMNCIEKTGVKV